MSPLAGFGPRFLRGPALQPFGSEAGLGAHFPDAPCKGARASCPHWRVSDPDFSGPRLCSRSDEKPVQAFTSRNHPHRAPVGLGSAPEQCAVRAVHGNTRLPATVDRMTRKMGQI